MKDIKPYWFFVAGLILLALFAVIVIPRRLGPGGTRRPWLGPGGTQAGTAWLGPGGTRSLLGSSGYAEMFENPSPKLSLVYTDWCGYCKKFKPVWESLGPTVTIGGRQVVLDKINAEAPEDAAKLAPYKSLVQGYPSMIFENDGKIQKYAGERTPAAITAFLQQQFSA